jgi:hypothetical protein
MVRIKVVIDDSILQEVLDRLNTGMANNKSMPATARAAAEAAQLVQATWRDYAMGKKELAGTVPMKKPSRGYIEGIKIIQQCPFDYDIVNTAKNAAAIEYGTPELDMKTTHPYGPRSRVSKKGVPYLIVPFNWKTPKALGSVMPQSIYNIVRNKNKFDRTIVDNTKHIEPNARGEDVERNNYKQWGSRLTMPQIFKATKTVPTIDTKQFFNMNGMVAMEGSTEQSKHAQYFTFRVISAEGAPGSWVKPATPARNVTLGVKSAVEQDVNKLFEAGFMEDLEL